MEKDIRELSIAALRSLIIDMTRKAGSGHPGLALGSAPMIYSLFTNHLHATPFESTWHNRDRFVLASGHASPLLYGILHLCGYQVSIEDIKQFRQLDSLTPGHPEVGHTDGVDATSGPLGQGVAQAVGLALAEKILAAKYNRDGYPVIDHYTYCLCGDGDIQEGLTQEAASLAGLWRLNKLVLIYDANNITLDGGLETSLSEDVGARFRALGWNVLECQDGNNLKRINFVLKRARKSERPTLIINRTIIGFGSRHQGTNKVHGAPLDAEDAAFAKASYQYDYPDFTVPEEVYEHFHQSFYRRGTRKYRAWKRMMGAFSKSDLESSTRLHRELNGRVSADFDWPVFELGFRQATRHTSQVILNAFASHNPHFVGGSADVAGSVMTMIKGEGLFSDQTPTNRNFQFGVREFAMASIANGMALHRGLRPYVGAFMVFSDYCKAAIRMACLERLPILYLFSHDSIAVGEDGPTHQPIEQLAMLRSIPGMTVFRPCDANEVAYSYRYYAENPMPTAIALTRQNVDVAFESSYEEFRRGAYVVSKSMSRLPYQLFASGSEVGLALKVKRLLLENHQMDVKVISMPSMELFRRTPKSYHRMVLGDKRRNIAIEMATPFGLHEVADHVIGIESFGTSAPLDKAIAHFGFTPEAIVTRILEIIHGREMDNEK